MTKQAISPLRQRMIEDMAIRKLSPKTQHDYVQRVKDFATFLGRSPDQAQSEDVRGFRLHLASIGAHAPKINTTVSALRFFFNVTLDRPEPAHQYCRRSQHAALPVLWRSHDHHRGVRARCNATASADGFDQPYQDRHLMIASQSCKTARCARHLSTGHGRPRSDFQPAAQIVRQFIVGDAILRPFIGPFTVEQLAASARSKSASSPAAFKSP